MLKFRKFLKSISLFLLTCLLAFSSFTADAHPGRLDRFWGHMNHKTGTYHYHRRSNAVRKKAVRKRTRKTVRTRRTRTRSRKVRR